MTGGTLSGSNGNRVVRVTTPGKASITVTADGKTTPFEFRVKEIPSPIFKVGPGGTRMTSGSFKSQQYCRAELENFDFAANFSVISATVYLVQILQMFKLKLSPEIIWHLLVRIYKELALVQALHSIM